MNRALRGCVLLFAALALPARADVLLDGHQHIGDNESGIYTPSDPVTLDEFSNSATRFHLTSTIQVTAVRMDGFIGANLPIRVELDGNNRAGTHANGLITLNQTRTLTAGVHTLALDPGCLRGGIQEFGNRCRNQDDEYDIGFSSITLVTLDSAQVTVSRNLTRRRHLGDTNDFSNNNFGDRFYPDAPEGATLNIPFTVDRNGQLNEVRFYRLRDVGSSSQVLSRARVSVVNASGTATLLGTLTGNGNPFIISTALLLAAGNYSIRVEAGQMKSSTSDQDKNNDDVRWNDILLLLVNDVASTPGRFNAVDPAQDPVTGVVTTKVAGTPLDVDITAINNGALVPTYSGITLVELLDASDDSGAVDAYGCRSSWSPVLTEALGLVVFTAVDGGRKRLSAEVLDAYPKARLRMTDTLLSVSGCSTDVFAVRPATFAVQVTDQDAETPGTLRALDNLGASGGTTHKAGRTFTIRATALNADGLVTPGYIGSPTVLAAASLLGANVGEARADIWTPSSGVVQTDGARYNEAGAFSLELRDTSFAAVDAGDGSTQVQREIGPITTSVGRFTPDHFDAALNTPEFTPACGAFTYSGQSFRYSPGLAPVVTLTAVAYGAPTTTTTNYTGTLFKLPASLAASVYAPTIVDAANPLPVPDAIVAEVPGTGLATVTLSEPAAGFAFARTTPQVPFDAEIAATLATIADSEGITTATTPVVFGSTTAPDGIAFTGAAKEVRFGRLVVDNAHGSERLPLDVPLRAEYWTAQGFATSTGDGCSNVLAAANILVGPASPVSLVTSASAIVAPTPRGSVTLDAPNQTGYAGVTVDLSAALMPWLRGDWNANGNWNEDADDPFGRASFGLSRQNDRRIYQREVVGG